MIKPTHIDIARFFADYDDLDAEERLDIYFPLDIVEEIFNLYDWYKENCRYIRFNEMDSFRIMFGPEYNWAYLYYDDEGGWYINISLELDQAKEIFNFIQKFDSLCGD